jgi:hypothetical protein
MWNDVIFCSFLLVNYNAALKKGSRHQDGRLVVKGRTTNYYYLALCLYQLIEAGEGSGMLGRECPCVCVRQWIYEHSSPI